MKKRNVLAMAGVTLLAVGVLAACSSSKSGSSNTNTNFTYVYQTDPETLDYTLSSKTSTHEITSNVIDGLLEMTNMVILFHLLQKTGVYLRTA